MAITFLTGDSAASTTTAALNSTGATLAIVHAASWPSQATTITEGGGFTNTWTPLASIANASHTSRLFYSLLTSTGAGHTFTQDGGSATIEVALFSGFSGGVTLGNFVQAATLAPGTVTPTSNGALILSAAVCQNASNTAVTGGLTIIDAAIGGGGFVGSTMAYLIQGTAGALAPVWSGGTGAVAAQTLVIQAAAAGGGASTQTVLVLV